MSVCLVPTGCPDPETGMPCNACWEEVSSEACPSCGARRDECIRVIRRTKGRACCIHCAESPIEQTHRGPREV